jgi:hypothetical protein
MGLCAATAASFVVTTVSISLWPNVLITFVDQVKRLLALSYGRFEATHHKTRSRSIQETLVKEGWSLFQRSLSRKPCEQPTKEK